MTSFKDKYIIFKNDQNKDYHQLSNPYICEFYDDESGITFSCANHYIAYKKAIFENNNEILKNIHHFNENLTLFRTFIYREQLTGKHRDENNKEYKKWQEWLEVYPIFLKEALILKFSQNPELADILVDTGDKILLYLNIYDPFLGISTWEKTTVTGKYKGKNVLGDLLMEVRDMAVSWL